MGDFPKGGNIETTRARLDKEGFFKCFKKEEEKLLRLVSREDGWRLWGFLNTARAPQQGKLSHYPRWTQQVFFRVYYLLMIILIIGYFIVLLDDFMQ